MKQVIFITVKISTESEWLNDKMLQLTLAGQHQLSEGKYPIYVVDKYEDINQYMDQAEWLFVETAGDIIINRDHLWKKLHNIDQSVGVIGHLMWYPEDPTPHLHEQCFILNFYRYLQRYWSRICQRPWRYELRSCSVKYYIV